MENTFLRKHGLSNNTYTTLDKPKVVYNVSLDNAFLQALSINRHRSNRQHLKNTIY